MANVDITEALKAVRAARADAEKEPLSFTIGPPFVKKPVTFSLVPRLPWNAGDRLAEGRFEPFMKAILGGNGQLEKFDALGLDMEEFGAVVEQVTALYGTSAGESPASSSS